MIKERPPIESRGLAESGGNRAYVFPDGSPLPRACAVNVWRWGSRAGWAQFPGHTNRLAARRPEHWAYISLLGWIPLPKA